MNILHVEICVLRLKTCNYRRYPMAIRAERFDGTGSGGQLGMVPLQLEVPTSMGNAEVNGVFFLDENH